ncbi:MAG TPA: glycosyltransferase [Burkholderiaceae bacterium]
MSRIATLIPAYKSDYLAPLFAGLRSQTFKDFRVILSDDSPDGAITAMLRAGRFDPLVKDLDLLVVRGPCSMLKNHQHLLDVWAQSTPLVHLLMDDDVIYPDFYREHAALHARHTLTASVSLRWLTGGDGTPFATLPLPDFVEASGQRTVEVGTAPLFASTVARCENWLGELSNMVLSARAAGCFPRPPADGVSYFGLPDIGTVLNAATQAPIMVLRDHLGGFRQHAGQTTANTQSINLKIAFLAWVAFALQARHDGHIDAAAAVQAILIATQRCLQHYANDPLMQGYFEIVRNDLADLPRFETAFAAFWQGLLHACPDTRREPAPASACDAAHTAAPDPRCANPVVLDDFFPNLLTGFRVAEYNAYLAAFPTLRVLSSAPDFAARHAEYAVRYPQFADRVLPLTAATLAGCDLAMMNFLNNAHRFVPLLEPLRIPFVLTLYPGGGFGIGCPDSDRKLARVLASPLLRHLVTTQPISAEYVSEFAAQHGLTLPTTQTVPGVVVHPRYFDESAPVHEAYFGAGKPQLDICFVAEKYMPRGVNKGYPEFIGAAHELLDVAAIRFHVVGSFGPDDIDVRPLGERIQFHGRLETGELQRFFAGMDLIVALSRPGSLHSGNFDGFPTGSAVEASLAGVAVVASDVLGQNPGYVDGESMLLVAPHAAEVVRRVRELVAEPGRIATIARAGQACSRQLYAPEAQIAPRVAVLESAARGLGLHLQRG